MKKIYTFLFAAIILSSAAFAATFPITIATTSTSCPAASNGILVISVAGGTAPYTYSINAGAQQASNTFTGLMAGTYTVLVIDGIGDTGTGTAVITTGAGITASVVTTPASCAGNDGSIVINPSGTGPFQFSIDGGTTNQVSNTFNGLASGTYTVSVMDANGCTGNATAIILLDNPLAANAGPDVTICAGESVQLSGSGGGTYEWIPGFLFNDSSLANPVATPPFTYIIILTVTNGICTGSDMVTVTVNDPQAIAGNDTTICAGSSVQLSSGFGATTFLWTPPVGLSDPTIANPIATPLTNTTYHLTASAGPCTSSDDITIMVSPLPLANAGPDLSICTGGSVQLSGSGGNIYFWTPSTGLDNPLVANPISTPAASIEYVMTVTDATGCEASDAVSISVQSLDEPVVTASGSLLTVTNPEISASYTWQVLNGVSWEDIVPTATGTAYTATSPAEYRVRAESGVCTTFSNSLLAGRPASSNEFGIYTYPNPTTGYLVLDELKLSDAWETIEIINTQGARLLTRNIRNQTRVTLNVNALGNGVYNARLRKTDGGSTMIRFVKQ